MRILNIGSLNIDKVYNVPHFVQPGETILSDKYEEFLGGKGLNQTLALARAGAEVWHAGVVGGDGNELAAALFAAGVHTELLQQLQSEVSGHAIIQLTPQGQNNIIVYPGANNLVTEKYIDDVLAHFSSGDLLLLQNETTCVPYAIQAAKQKGLRVAINPSPVTDALPAYPLDLADYLMLNEVEGAALTGQTGYEDILEALHAQYPQSCIILTVGKEGAYYRDPALACRHGIYDVPVVDTTAAGDTFCGFFVASIARGLLPQQALEIASRASSIAVSRKGASVSIPTWDEVQALAMQLIG